MRKEARIPAAMPAAGSQEASLVTKDPNTPLMMELCCGTAGVSRAFADLGWKCIALDKRADLVYTNVEIMAADLTNDNTQARVLELIELSALKYCHMAPPCGTASRARDKPLPAALRAKGIPEPPRARSELHPLGLPNLAVDAPKLHLRVLAANEIYIFLAKVASRLAERKIPFTIENPNRSYLWMLPCFRGLLGPQAGDVTFDMCMYGGARKVLRRLRAFPIEKFLPLCALCDGSHEHKPWIQGCSWSSFGTAEEAVYPPAFCLALAALFGAGPTRVSSAPQADAGATLDTTMVAKNSVNVELKTGTGIQARGKKAAPLVPEFDKVLTITASQDDLAKLRNQDDSSNGIALACGVIGPCKILQVISGNGDIRPAAEPLQVPTRLAFSSWRSSSAASADLYIGRAHRDSRGRVFPSSVWANPFKLKDCGGIMDCLARYRAHLSAMKGFPSILRALSGRRLVCHCRSGDRCHADELIQAFETNVLEQNTGCDLRIRLGVYRQPSEFVAAARELAHPFGRQTTDDLIKISNAKILSDGVDATRLRWKTFAEHWRQRAAHLQPEEDALHATLHPEVAAVIKVKRLLVFGEMLQASGFPGSDRLIKAISRGFDVVGDLDCTGAFETFPRKPSSGVEHLRRTSQFARAMVIDRTGPSKDAELDAAVAEITASELQRGWLRGPFSEAELDERLGRWVPARRFGIRQGSSVRAIDDYSVAGHNMATSVGEKVDMGGIDTVVAIARQMLAAASSRNFAIGLDDGRVIDGKVHSSLQGKAAALVGKEWDLAKAYRQLARNPEHAWATVVSSWNPSSRKVELYEQPVLAFGAASSVQHFCWAARALWHILVTLGGIACTHYVDNYTVICFAALAHDAQALVDAFFSIVGWETKEQDPFAASFVCLGACVSFEAVGHVVVSNKAARLKDLMREVEKARLERDMSRTMAKQLRGRIGFMRAQVFGRVGAPALRLLSLFAEGHSKNAPTLDELLQALDWLIAIFSVARPRKIPACFPMPAVLFTDGACEPDELGNITASCGAVLYVPGRGPAFFGLRIGGDVLKHWLRDGKQQVIAQAELLPVWLAKVVWKRQLMGRPLLTFVDNESALANLVAGYTGISDSAAITHASAMEDARLSIHQWVARVPSKSNIADDPSRLRFSDLRGTEDSTEFVLDGVTAASRDIFWSRTWRTLYE